MFGGHEQLEPHLVTPSEEYTPTVSPSGRFVAYMSNESGRVEIYVRPFPTPERKWPVSTRGGRKPVWGRDERELFHWEGRRLMASAVSSGPDLTIGARRPVDVTRDGQRFVAIPNFASEMRTRLSARKAQP